MTALFKLQDYVTYLPARRNYFVAGVSTGSSWLSATIYSLAETIGGPIVLNMIGQTELVAAEIIEKAKPKKRKTYIAGPMTSLPYFNADAFFDAQAHLEDEGYKAINPAQHDIDTGFDPYNYPDGNIADTVGKFDLKEALLWDLKQVATSDFITLLSGWEKSSGVRAELALAFALGIPVKLYSEPVAVEHWDVLTKEGWLKAYETSTAKLFLAPVGSDQQDRSNWNEIKGVTNFTLMNGEVRTTSSTGGQKGMKDERFDLIPVGPLTELARHYGVGAKKYDDNQWRKGYEWSKSFAALQRHANEFWGGEDFDPETGSNHMAAVAWHAFTLLEFYKEHPQFDDRFKGNDLPPSN